MTKPMFDFLTFVRRHREWSERTFGPGDHAAALVAHIRKECHELEANPGDLFEWIDVIILALDGAGRAGHSSRRIVDALLEKQRENENRIWPDWRTVEAGTPFEHTR